MKKIGFVLACLLLLSSCAVTSPTLVSGGIRPRRTTVTESRQLSKLEKIKRTKELLTSLETLRKKRHTIATEQLYGDVTILHSNGTVLSQYDSALIYDSFIEKEGSDVVTEKIFGQKTISTKINFCDKTGNSHYVSGEGNIIIIVNNISSKNDFQDLTPKDVYHKEIDLLTEWHNLEPENETIIELINNILNILEQYYEDENVNDKITATNEKEEIDDEIVTLITEYKILQNQYIATIGRNTGSNKILQKKLTRKIINIENKLKENGIDYTIYTRDDLISNSGDVLSEVKDLINQAKTMDVIIDTSTNAKEIRKAKHERYGIHQELYRYYGIML